MPVLCPALRQERPPDASREEEPLAGAAEDQDRAFGHVGSFSVRVTTLLREGGAQPHDVWHGSQQRPHDGETVPQWGPFSNGHV